MSNNHNSKEIPAAWIVGGLTFLGAIVGGVFLLINTLLQQGFVITSPQISGPSVQVGNPQIDTKLPSQSNVSITSQALTVDEVISWCRGEACDDNRFEQLREANGVINPYGVKLKQGPPVSFEIPSNVIADIWNCYSSSTVNGPSTEAQVCEASFRLPYNTLAPIPTHTSTTMATNPLMPTPTPFVIPVSVPSNSEAGIRVDVPASGWYQLKYVKGAFSPWSEEAPDSRGWATHTQVFVNREIEWGITNFGLPGPINFDAYLGADGYYSTVDGAVNATIGKIASIRQLKAGDYINLVVVDERGQYSNNRGNVELELIRISP